MAKQQWLVKLFNIRPEEKKPVLYLMTFSFFVGLAMTFYFAASNAIFLKHFQSYMISVSYMASGVIVFVAWWVLSRLDRRLNLPRQLIFKFLFVFITVAAISTGVWLYDAPWLVFVMFTWIRILVYVTLVTFWGLAGKLFNIRQGKRVFGLLGIGEVTSIIIGYFSVPLLMRFLKAPDLLFLSSGALFICLLFILLILRTFREELADVKAAPGAVAQETREGLNYWSLIKKPYFLIISLMALLPIFGYLFVDFLFLAQTKKEFANNPEAIAGFFGIFLGIVAVIELLFKFVSGRFLSKYGVKPSLISLPLILFAGILMAAVSGTFYGTVGMFFAFIALARLFERSVRSAIYEPAFQLLYQPVPSEHRLVFQNQIEGIPKASGTVITGAVILLFSSVVTFNLVHYSWFFIAVLGLWIWLAFRMYDQYRSMLKTKLGDLRKTDENATPLRDIIRKSLIEAGPDRFQEVFDLLYSTHPLIVEDLIPEIYETAGPAKKTYLLEIIAENHLISALNFLKREEKREQEGMAGKIREVTAQFESRDIQSYSYLLKLTQSDRETDRIKAARILGSSGRYETFRLLSLLIRDPEPPVRRAAILAAGKTRRIELWPHIIENLPDQRFASGAIASLKLIGEPVLPDLERLFEKSGESPETRLNILSVFEAVDSPISLKFLRARIFHPDRQIRKKVLTVLSSLGYQASVAESAGLKNDIGEIVDNILWIQATILDTGRSGSAGDLQVALLDQLEDDKEYLFMILSLMYEPKTIRHIRENIESNDTTARVYALEIGDMLIGEEIKQILFPVFEDMSMQERLQRFSTRFPQEQMAPLQRLIDILNRETSKSGLWTKACAIQKLFLLHPQDPEIVNKLLAANIVHPHPLIGELSAQTLLRRDPEYYHATMTRLTRSEDPRMVALDRIIRERESGERYLLPEKVKMLKGTEVFFYISEYEIINMLLRHPGIHFYKDGDSHTATVMKSGYSLFGEDCTIIVPKDILREQLAISSDFAIRYLTSMHQKTLNEGS
jgi:ATP:ADP antiporter, AAA family